MKRKKKEKIEKCDPVKIWPSYTQYHFYISCKLWSDSLITGTSKCGLMNEMRFWQKIAFRTLSRENAFACNSGLLFLHTSHIYNCIGILSIWHVNISKQLLVHVQHNFRLIPKKIGKTVLPFLPLWLDVMWDILIVCDYYTCWMVAYMIRIEKLNKISIWSVFKMYGPKIYNW